MSDKTLHIELKKALSLFDSNITEFSQNLIRPNGVRGVSHTYVIRVAQSKEESDWVEDAIEDIIQKAHKEFPESYRP